MGEMLEAFQVARLEVLAIDEAVKRRHVAALIGEDEDFDSDTLEALAAEKRVLVARANASFAPAMLELRKREGSAVALLVSMPRSRLSWRQRVRAWLSWFWNGE